VECDERCVHYEAARSAAESSYRNTGTSAAGTQTEWRGEWYFEPGVPKAASVLTLRLDTPKGAVGPATYLCEISRCLRFQD
jgi:hypothetical protein